MSMAERRNQSYAAAVGGDAHEPVGELISDRLGYPVCLLGSEINEKVTKTGQVKPYGKYMFQKEGDPHTKTTVFVKPFRERGLESDFDKLFSFLSTVDMPEFTTPRYFGMVNIYSGGSALKLGVWEYITDMAPFDADHAWADQAWRGARERFALAAAAMAALTQDVRRHVPNLRVGIKFVRPSAEIVDEAMINYARRGLDVAPLRSAAATFVGLEAAALEKLASLGGYFTHNDYRRGNLALSPDDKLVVFDWESASLAPPGAALRVMARLTQAEQSAVVALYCERLAASGSALSPQDVLFAMRAVEVFKAISSTARRFGSTSKTGTRFRWGFDIFEWGLNNLEYLRV